MTALTKLTEKYRGRNHSLAADAAATALSFADELAVCVDGLDEATALGQGLSAVSTALPFGVVLATEGYNVMAKKKTVTAAFQDARFRLLRNGAAFAVGAACTACAAGAFAIPASVCTRLLAEKARAKALLQKRVEQRIKRIQKIHARRLGGADMKRLEAYSG